MTDDDPTDFVRLRALTNGASVNTTTAQVVGVGAEGSDDAAERWDDVEVVQPAGLRAAPAQTATLEGLAMRRGDEAVVIHVLDKGATRQTPEAGETRLYGVGASNATAVIRVRANGDIEVTATGGQVVRIGAKNGEVVISGGTLKNARVTDPLNVGTLVATAGPYPVLFAYVPGTAGPTPPAPPGGVALTGVIASSGGNANVKS
jgi:hypothetical protein